MALNESRTLIGSVRLSRVDVALRAAFEIGDANRNEIIDVKRGGPLAPAPSFMRSNDSRFRCALTVETKPRMHARFRGAPLCLQRNGRYIIRVEDFTRIAYLRDAWIGIPGGARKFLSTPYPESRPIVSLSRPASRPVNSA
jgi:hypothetical protein